MKAIIAVLVILFIAGGIPAVCVGFETMWEVIKAVFIGFFPIIEKGVKVSLENYLTSPYFIVGVIMAIASAFGIWFGAKGGKILWLIVSIICELISLASIGINIF